VKADINLEASLQKSSPKPASIQILSSRNQQKAKKIGQEGGCAGVFWVVVGNVPC